MAKTEFDAHTYDFVGAYDKDMASLHSVRNATASRINDAVMAQLEDMDNTVQQISVEQEIAPDIAFMNDRRLESEGFSREDMEAGRLPAYMEDMISDESRYDGRNFDDEIESVKTGFYTNVYHVDSVLTEETKQNLGSEYAEFVVEQHNLESATTFSRLQQEAREQNGARSTFFDKETGQSYLSLTDEFGNSTNDPYAYDEGPDK